MTTAQRWWPSRFGGDDERGMLNLADEAKRVAALSLVREGRMFDLGHELHEDIPVFPGRFFRQRVGDHLLERVGARPGQRELQEVAS